MARSIKRRTIIHIFVDHKLAAKNAISGLNVKYSEKAIPNKDDVIAFHFEPLTDDLILDIFERLPKEALAYKALIGG